MYACIKFHKLPNALKHGDSYATFRLTQICLPSYTRCDVNLWPSLLLGSA
jgi:hypothetical protein